MLTFLIVIAVMLLLFLFDFLPLLSSGPARVTVFYGVAMGAAAVIIALHCFWGNMAGI